MKNLISIFIIIFVSANLFAQTNIRIKKTDNTVIGIPTSEIDSICYYILTNCGTVTDIDGNEYQTINIGTQCWMAEDLKVTHYPNGDTIPHITDNTAWTNLNANNTDDAYCFYNNDNTTDYGALYTYAAAIADNWTRDNTDGQGVCPDGWHLPTNEEWITLTDYIGGQVGNGGKLKEVGTTHWKYVNVGATNESGFTALPGGCCNIDGSFYGMTNSGDWWSTTEYSDTTAYYRNLSHVSSSIICNYYNKSMGFSIRCVKD